MPNKTSNARNTRTVAKAAPKRRSLADAGFDPTAGSGLYCSAASWFGDGTFKASELEYGEVSNVFLIVGAKEDTYQGSDRVVLSLCDPEDAETIYLTALAWTQSRASLVTAFEEDDTPILARFKTVDSKQPMPFMAIVEADETGDDDADVPF